MVLRFDFVLLCYCLLLLTKCECFEFLLGFVMVLFFLLTMYDCLLF